MATVSRHKGVGLLPIVKALKLAPERATAVPAGLRFYLEDHYVVTSEWYPERDYNVLVQVLADIVKKAGQVSDVWEYFGKTAAQRDLMGWQALIPEASRLEEVGAYRNFVTREGPSIYSLFVRLGKLWSMYHDTGRMTVARSASDECVVIVRVADFVFPSRGLVELQMAYCCECGHLTGNKVKGQILSATPNQEPVTEWAYTCERTKEIMDSIAQLPVQT
jgi:hypothetical protein